MLRHGKWDSVLHRKWSLVLGGNLQASSRTNAALSRERTKKLTPIGAGLILLYLAWRYCVTQPAYIATQPVQAWPKNQPQYMLPLIHTVVKGQGRRMGLFQKGNWGEKSWESRPTQAKGLNKKKIFKIILYQRHITWREKQKLQES